ncbi:MAG: DUF192 domain-containing protein [Planctomycetota bacterium]|nr:MAG: DUF192 domain-containing protein [Planctomycetota bacterium]
MAARIHSSMRQRRGGIGAAVCVCLLGGAPGGCGASTPPSKAQTSAPEAQRVLVRVKGEPFKVEVALDPQTRYRGLSFRSHIGPDEGMLFVFPTPQRLAFVMRDCLVPIDIAFLDGAGRVLAVHSMQLEPRKKGESDADYNARLTRYSSRYRAQLALETAGGRLQELGLKPGDKVHFDFDLQALKRRAR